jgi:hypothetical protein
MNNETREQIPPTPGLSFSSVVGAGSMPDRQTDFRPGQNDFPALGGHPSQQHPSSSQHTNATVLPPVQLPSSGGTVIPPSNNDPFSLFGLIDIIRLTDHDSAMVSLGYVL